ncbi:hypothetical protein VNI00_007044 [Paramarasmius palmivorus]|uniref:Uncharacterized protein n=1 Tax=Paramarasmius palmivorus TaxID=297713 RepID=A0AAW0D2R9_9AGAR
MSLSEKPRDSATNSTLQFDPGLAPPTRRKQSGCKVICKYILWTIVLFVAGSLLFFLASLGRNFVNSTIRFAHTSVYQNGTWEEVVAHGKQNIVVRPLVDEEQTFDIAITVWVRRTEEEQDSRLPAVTEDIQRQSDSEAEENERDLREQAIYSGIAFRKVQLKDKNVATEIPLQIPTRVFLSENITTHDLRASVILIPNSPSLLDHVSNFSSWYPPTVNRPRMRNLESLSPFDSSTADVSTLDLHKEAIDSFGLNINLVTLYDSKDAASGNETSSENIIDDFWTMGLDEAPEPAPTTSCYAMNSSSSDEIIRAKPSHKKQPYIKTRTQIRVSDETHIFNRRAYVKKHKALKAKACGFQPTKPDKPLDFFQCNRTYTQNGNWETVLHLQVPSSTNEEEYETQWAYAPYLSSLQIASGFKDFVRVPVTRQVCDQNATRAVAKLRENFADSDLEFMNITWHLSFSGRKPNKLATAEELDVLGPNPETNLTERQSQAAHEKAELYNGIFGHAFYPDAHPRRKAILLATRLLISIPISVLKLMYWSSRTSSVHISIRGSWALAVSLILNSLVEVLTKVAKADTSKGWWSVVTSLLFAAIFSWPVPILMIRTVLPMELLWPGLNEASFTRRPWFSFLSGKASHRERASARLDSRTNKRIILLVYPVVVLFWYFAHPVHLFLIPSTIPISETSDSSRLHVAYSFIAPLWLIGRACQVALNFRSGIFAGDYPSTVYLTLFNQLITFSLLCPFLLGRDDSRLGLNADQLFDFALVAVSTWQAIKLPRHKPELDVDDEDSR